MKIIPSLGIILLCLFTFSGVNGRAQNPATSDSILQSTFLGGEGREEGFAVAVNTATGDVYIAGLTSSSDLPGLPGGADVTFGGISEGFIARFSSDLKTLYRSTYIGGSGEDVCYGIAIDPATGDVIVTGYTTSNDLPGISGGADEVFAGYNEAFVARFSADLRVLYQTTYLGGEGYDVSYGVTINPSGEIYVTGVTDSPGFPGISGGADVTIVGDDSFVSKLSADLKTLYQSTYLGGASYDAATAIAINPGGDIYLTGTTGSADLPGIAGGADEVFSKEEAFVSRLSADLRSLIQSTYIGGSAGDWGNGIAIHPKTGNVYITGGTLSENFPNATGGADTIFDVGEAFVSRLSEDLTVMHQSTYLGGAEDETGHGIAIHPATNGVYVAGRSASEGFLAGLSEDLTGIHQYSMSGGKSADSGNGIAINPASGKIYVSGSTTSDDLPMIKGGADAVFSGRAYTNIIIKEGTGGDDTQVNLGTINPDYTLQIGKDGKDTQYISGADGNDWLGQLGGNDGDNQTIRSGTEDDLAYQIGGNGDDLQFGEGADGMDWIYQFGGEGSDDITLIGGLGNDFLFQNAQVGDDTLKVDSGDGDDFVLMNAGSGNDTLTYEVSPGNDQVFINSGTGMDGLKIHAGSQNLTMFNTNGRIIFHQGSGGSEIWLRSMETITVIDPVDNPIYHQSDLIDITGGPDLSTHEAGHGEAFIAMFKGPGALGLEAIPEQSGVRIYPNPNDGTFDFKYHSAKTGPIRISVMDMTGKVVFDRNFENGLRITRQIEIPGRMPGVYIVRVVSESAVEYRKVVVE